MNREKIIDKAKKLRELADRGVGGEQENARRMLETHKEKYNITDQEIDGHTYSSDFYFENMNPEDILNWILSDKEFENQLIRFALAVFNRK